MCLFYNLNPVTQISIKGLPICNLSLHVADHGDGQDDGNEAQDGQEPLYYIDHETDGGPNVFDLKTQKNQNIFE
jgi:hypothetical protein